MRKMTMVREKWGKGKLCDEEGNLCILGLYGREILGLNNKQMENYVTLAILFDDFKLKDKNIHAIIHCPMLGHGGFFHTSAWNINDTAPKKYREGYLIELFAQIDIELNFVDTEADLKEESEELDFSDISYCVTQKMTHTPHEAWA